MPIIPCNDVDSDLVRYINNLVFEDDIAQTTTNIHFPGSVDSILCRADLPIIFQLPSTHVPYKKQEIISWFSPNEIAIPQLGFTSLHHSVGNMKQLSTVLSTIHGKITKSTIEISTLDFGFGDLNDGTLNILYPLEVDVSELDFDLSNIVDNLV